MAQPTQQPMAKRVVNNVQQNNVQQPVSPVVTNSIPTQNPLGGQSGFPEEKKSFFKSWEFWAILGLVVVILMGAGYYFFIR